MNAPSANVAAAAGTPEEAAVDSSLELSEHSKDELPEGAEDDEEVRLAMEMALAAARNPKLTPDELRKLVAGKSQQMQMADEIQEKKAAAKQKEREEAQQRWTEKKQKAMKWWKGKTNQLSETAEQVKAAAAARSQELKDQAERRLYWDKIKNDNEIIETRTKLKVIHKILKAHRLQGNREETRHAFKRQRMERKLIQLEDKLLKTQELLTATQFNIHEYAKAMMRASKKWKKKCSDQELALEANLCRNMHQMLAIEKQKVKVKKTTREIKKYLQRCKSWLSDKKAFSEMHIMTLDATQSSMVSLYEDALTRQDALIARLKASEEFADVDLSDYDGSHFDKIPEHMGAGATLYALRGLPIEDSIRLTRTHEKAAPHKKAPPKKAPPPPKKETKKAEKPELYIATKDDISVNSNLSDPDEVDDPGFESNFEFQNSQSENSGYDFGKDSPWNKSDSQNESSEAGSSAIDPKTSVGEPVPEVPEEQEQPEATVEETAAEEENEAPAELKSHEAKEKPAKSVDSTTTEPTGGSVDSNE